MAEHLGKPSSIGPGVNGMLLTKADAYMIRSLFWGFSQETLIDIDINNMGSGDDPILELIKELWNNATSIPRFMVNRAPARIKSKIKEGKVLVHDTKMDKVLDILNVRKSVLVSKMREMQLDFKATTNTLTQFVPSHVQAGVNELQTTWSLLWKIAEEMNIPFSQELYKQYCGEISMILSGYTATEQKLIAAKIWDNKYNRPPRDADVLRVLKGGSYGDALLWTVDTPEGTGLGNITIDMLNSIGDGISNIKIASRATGDVRVASRIGRMGIENKEVGDLNLKNGTYHAAGGYMQVRRTRDTLEKDAKAVVTSVTVVSGWSQLINSGDKTESDVTAWKVKYANRLATLRRTEYRGNPAWEVIGEDDSLVGHIARGDIQSIPGECVVKLQTHGKYTLTAIVQD